MLPLPGRVVFFGSAGGDRGGQRARSDWPATTLSAVGWRARSTAGWIEVRPGDVAVIHRPLTPEWMLGEPLAPLESLRAYHEAGAAVLVDIDDELEAVPFHGKAVSSAQIRAHHQTVKEADGLIATTARLAEIYGQMAKRTWIVPNYVPAWVCGIRSDLPRGEHVRVGWAGSLVSHRQDIEWLAPQAARMLDGAEFVSVGSVATAEILGVERSIIEPYESGIRAFYSKMARADIGIVPLNNTHWRARRFNESRSDLKAKEFLALGCPVVATNFPAQAALLRGTDAGWVADTPRQFAGYVRELVRSSDRRERATQAACRLAQTLTLEARINEWTEPILEVARG